jgi:hypothetical protein
MDILIRTDYLEGLSIAKIAKKRNVSNHFVYKTLKNAGIVRDLSKSHITRTINEEFFSKIDSEEKAYFLGFLYADGSITHNSFKLTLHPQDQEILIKFKQSVNSSHKIILDRNFYPRFSITNKRMYEDLIKLGCGHKKSLTLKFPNEQQVPSNLLNHFIRGFFDGDGSVNFTVNKKYGYIQWIVTFTSSIEFNLDLQRKFSDHIDSKFSELKLYKEKDNDKVCYFQVGGTNESRIKNIYEFLYKDSLIFLNRKKAKFEEIITLIHERN